MRNSITQDMRFRQSLMQYAAKYSVSRASRKYNKTRSYICFWKARWDGSAASLACQSRRPHHHPKHHTEAERKLIRDMRKRNPTLGMAVSYTHLDVYKRQGGTGWCGSSIPRSRMRVPGGYFARFSFAMRFQSSKIDILFHLHSE